MGNKGRAYRRDCGLALLFIERLFMIGKSGEASLMKGYLGKE